MFTDTVPLQSVFLWGLHLSVVALTAPKATSTWVAALILYKWSTCVAGVEGGSCGR